MMSYADFRKLVAEMMDEQGHYWKHRDNIERCKEVERRVRNELADLPEQPGLFDGLSEASA